MTTLEALSRNQLLALAELKKRNVDISLYLASNAPYNKKIVVEEEYAKCKGSFAYFCANYVWIAEPRKERVPMEDVQGFSEYLAHRKGDQLLDDELEILPDSIEFGTEQLFKLWDFQEDLGYWFDWLIVNGLSGAIEKCRDMGMTWLVMAYFVWRWLFSKGFSALVGSRKEAAVDDRTINSLFGKLDYIITRLPTWLLPKEYNRKKHRRTMVVDNPSNGNFIKGDSSTEDFGRSERYTIVFIDEFSTWQVDVSGSVEFVANAVLYGATVQGKNLFYWLTERLRAIHPDLVKTLKWDLNPNHLKNNWFEDTKRKLRPSVFASEVLIQYETSVEGAYYSFTSSVQIRRDLKWLSGKPSFAGWDFGVSDETAIIYLQKDSSALFGEQHRMMYCYSSNGKPIRFYVPFALARLPQEIRGLLPPAPVFDRAGGMTVEQYEQLMENYQLQVRLMAYSKEDLAFIQMLKDAGVNAALAHRGDPAGRQRSHTTATSPIQELRQFGINMQSFADMNRHPARREAASAIMLNMIVNSGLDGKSGAMDAFDAIQQARFPSRAESSQSTTTPTAPVHDWTSHYRSAFEYYAVGEAIARPFSSGVAGPRTVATEYERNVLGSGDNVGKPLLPSKPVVSGQPTVPQVRYPQMPNVGRPASGQPNPFRR